MKTRKRFAIIGGTIAIIMALAGMGIAEAFGGRPCGGPFAPFHRFHGSDKDMAGCMLARMDKKVKDLNLTPEQQTKYDELKGRVKERMAAAKEDRKVFRDTLRAEMAKETPDVAVMNAMMKKKIGDVSVAMQNGLDLFEEFYSILDEGQKQKVLAGIRKKMAAMDKCREE